MISSCMQSISNFFVGMGTVVTNTLFSICSRVRDLASRILGPSANQITAQNLSEIATNLRGRVQPVAQDNKTVAIAAASLESTTPVIFEPLARPAAGAASGPSNVGRLSESEWPVLSRRPVSPAGQKKSSAASDPSSLATILEDKPLSDAPPSKPGSKRLNFKAVPAGMLGVRIGRGTRF